MSKGLARQVCLLAVLLSATAQAKAEPQIESVTILQSAESIRVVYELDHSATSLPLPATSGPLPAANIRADPGFMLSGRMIKADRATRKFSIHISADEREVDSVYPLMLPVSGGSFILYAPYLIPPAAKAWLVRGRTRHRVDPKQAQGYLIVGRAATDRGQLRALVSAGAPPAQSKAMLDRAESLLAFYAQRLGRPPGDKPTLILSFGAAPASAGASFRGDVTPNGIIFLRIRSAEQGEAEIGRLSSFLAHELFHLWNRSGNSDPRAWWIHEGGAEYASWLARSTLWPGEAGLEQELSGALQTCAMYLGPRPMNSLSEPETRPIRYPCGAVLHWLADLGARSARPGRDGFEIWRRLFAARARSGTYTAADFESALEASAPRALAPIGTVLAGSGPQRWAEIGGAADAMGARVDVAGPTPFFQRLAASQSLVLSACGEVWGVGEKDGSLFVQAPQSCTDFGEEAIVVTAGGADPMADSKDYYDKVSAACAAGSEIEIRLRIKGNERTRRVKCTVAVNPPPNDIRIVRALPAPQ